MAHVRKTIRDKIVTLVTGLSTTGTNVFRSRVYPLESAKLPGLTVYTLDEDSQIITMGSTGNNRMDRVVEIAIEGYARETSNLDDKLDQIALEVEEAIAADDTLTGSAKKAELVKTNITMLGDGNQPIGAIRLLYEIQYNTTNGDVENSV